MEVTDILAKSSFLTVIRWKALSGMRPRENEERSWRQHRQGFGKFCCQRKQRYMEVARKEKGEIRFACLLRLKIEHICLLIGMTQ